MAYDKTFYSCLRKDRHDTQRAKIFDEWEELQSPQVQAYCDGAVKKLKARWGLGDHQAKALLVQAILFVHMKVDEQDRWRQHGEYIRAEFEWAYRGEKLDEFLQEVPA